MYTLQHVFLIISIRSNNEQLFYLFIDLEHLNIKLSIAKNFCIIVILYKRNRNHIQHLIFFNGY